MIRLKKNIDMTRTQPPRAVDDGGGPLDFNKGSMNLPASSRIFSESPFMASPDRTSDGHMNNRGRMGLPALETEPPVVSPTTKGPMARAMDFLRFPTKAAAAPAAAPRLKQGEAPPVDSFGLVGTYRGGHMGDGDRGGGGTGVEGEAPPADSFGSVGHMGGGDKKGGKWG